MSANIVTTGRGLTITANDRVAVPDKLAVRNNVICSVRKQVSKRTRNVVDRPKALRSPLYPDIEFVVPDNIELLDMSSVSEDSFALHADALNTLRELDALSSELEAQTEGLASWETDAEGNYVVSDFDKYRLQEVIKKSREDRKAERKKNREQRRAKKEAAGAMGKSVSNALQGQAIPRSPGTIRGEIQAAVAPPQVGLGAQAPVRKEAQSAPEVIVSPASRTVPLVSDLRPRKAQLATVEQEDKEDIANGIQVQPRQSLVASSKGVVARPDLNQLNLLETYKSKSAVAAPVTSRSSTRNKRNRQWGKNAVESQAPTQMLEETKLGHDAIDGLFKNISGTNLLNAEQEKELAQGVQDLVKLEKLQSALAKQLNRLPTMQEWAKAAKTDPTAFELRLKQGRAAKQMMIQSNHRLVVSICKKYQTPGTALQDLISEGIQGLIRGVQRFDPNKGFKLSTYAHWWIRQAINRSLSDQSRTVRLPVHLYENLMKARKSESELRMDLGREPTTEEIAKHAGITVKKVEYVYKLFTHTTSLEAPVKEGDGRTVADMVEDEARLLPDESAHETMMEKDLMGVLEGLNPRERGVLEMRFGLMDGTEYTLDEVGSVFKVTRERIRQIEARALRKLRARQDIKLGPLSEYIAGELEEKELPSRNSLGTRKSS